MVIRTFWQSIQNEAYDMISSEALLASFVHSCVINHKSLGEALSYILSTKLSDQVMPALSMREIFQEVYQQQPQVIADATADINAIIARDPAIDLKITALLYLKGFHAIQVHRIAHYLWKHDRRHLALFIQSRNAETFSVDIHPAAVLGNGIMFDHATGIVIGETAVVENNVSILQSVTLGGTGNEHDDRHPKVKEGVMIGAGAKILGNIIIGEGAKVGAGSVVLKAVPPHSTVAGVPAKIVGRPHCDKPCETMSQNIFADVISSD